MQNLKIAIIGAGNLSWSMIPALQDSGAQVIQIISRSKDKRERFAQVYNIPLFSGEVSALDPSADLVILTVGDHHIAGLAQDLGPYLSPKTTIVHCSGSTPLAALKPLGKRTGVFYPLQIFTLESLTEFKTTPLFLEGSAEVLGLLLPLAQALSSEVKVLDSAARLKLHLGAVMVCNFPNYLFRLSEELVPEIDIQAYEPLIRETLEKVFKQGPAHSQTGPAIRGDMSTMLKHLTILQDRPRLREMYWLLSRLINPSIEEEV